ncbi:MAG: hypothetical protein AAGU11_13785 [Syntrophobacteraceae bacterium]
MEQCRQCELAIYCYSDSSSWIFRTKQEMEEKTAAMQSCPIHDQIEEMRTAKRKAAG